MLLHLPRIGANIGLQIKDGGPSIKLIGHINMIERLDRYVQTKDYNNLINSKQFGMKVNIPYQKFLKPTITYREKMNLKYGDLE